MGLRTGEEAEGRFSHKGTMSPALARGFLSPQPPGKPKAAISHSPHTAVLSIKVWLGPNWVLS